jgi:hypothetical protein
VDGLPHNTERFKTIQINSFLFLDSYAFLSSSLATLVENLASNKKHKFHILDQMELYTKTNSASLKPLLLRKGLYPYEWAQDIQLLKKTKVLPPIKSFYSSLTDSGITREEHHHAEKVFSSFKCDNMLSYTNLYCATDCALLAEVVLSFRKEILLHFGLDPW